MSKRGIGWEWADINLNNLSFPEEWTVPYNDDLSKSIADVEEQRGGWICVAKGPTYVIGVNHLHKRILVMRKIQG